MTRLQYLQLINELTEIDTLIVGQDPYPEKPMGVPFCKESMTELFSESCCGKSLLYSLGITQNLVNKNDFKFPIDIFKYLLDKNIAFINICHDYINTEYIQGDKSIDFNGRLFLEYEAEILKAREYNLKFVEKTKYIYILGKLKTYPIFQKYYPEFTDRIVHPILEHPSKKNSSAEWYEAWGKPYLKNKIKSFRN